MTDILVKFLVTGFYSGKIKYMPGTFGTLVGVLIFQLISLNSLLNNKEFLHQTGSDGTRPMRGCRPGFLCSRFKKVALATPSLDSFLIFSENHLKTSEN